MTGYVAKHQRVYRARGKASAQICSSCGGTARDWAQIHGTEGEDPTDYQPMCRKCHQAYDGVTERRTAKLRGRKQPPDQLERRLSAIRNGRVRSTNTSGVPGVHRHSQNGNWVVQVRHVHGGCYADFADAVRARNALALKIYGSDARTYAIPERSG